MEGGGRAAGMSRVQACTMYMCLMLANLYVSYIYIDLSGSPC